MKVFIRQSEKKDVYLAPSRTPYLDLEFGGSLSGKGLSRKGDCRKPNEFEFGILNELPKSSRNIDQKSFLVRSRCHLSPKNLWVMLSC